MIIISLVENLKISLGSPMSINDAKKFIPNHIYQNAVLAEVNGILVDFFYIINKDIELNFINIEDYRVLPVLRHDTAHIMAEAVQELFPEVQVTIGPAIKDGFYYDFFTSKPFQFSDLELIETRMRKIVKNKSFFVKKVFDRKEAIKIFQNKGEKFKVHIINEIDEKEEISIYWQGKFFDLCRGPHLPSTKYAKYFKLTKISASYWKGDSKNISLQRIYGTAWNNKEDLEKYLFQQKEAEKRDHRVIGKSLSLFHFQNEAQGIAFWHHNGFTIYRLLQNYIRQKLEKHSYLEVKTPELVDNDLWKKSGHWDKFKENMFTLEDNKKQYALKPMNCPCHIQIFNRENKSYRDLPIRMSEFGSCYRREDSGALHGLLRVRNFIQDDAHIFCTKEQINSETLNFYNLLKEIYNDFGFQEIKVKFSDRPKVRAGTDEIWDSSEKALKNAISTLDIKWEINSGDGAFYGPKLEFILKDAIGREWQCGTLQVDFILAEKLNATYIDATGSKKHPIILHRAILGTFERFIGILIEQYFGAFPIWIAPIQVAILTITNKQDSYAQKIFTQLKNNSIRTILDIDSNKISYKIRKSLSQKIPISIILGEKEETEGKIAVRFREKEHISDITTLEDLTKFIFASQKQFLK
ncbi:MAG: threonine--tRNA ligase [Rickettsia sp.]|nr:threonine--tRNA ligase [Rickettsia sp.]